MKEDKWLNWSLIVLTLLILAGCSSQETSELNKVEDTTTVLETQKEVDTEQGQTIDVKQYSEFLEPMFENKALELAWGDYEELMSKVTLANSYDNQSQGTSSKAFDSLNLIDVDYEEGDFGDKGKLRLYRYETEDPFQEEVNQEPGRASLIVLFDNDRLTYLGLDNSSFLFSQDKLIDQAKIKDLVSGPFDFEELGHDQALVTSFATKQVNNHQYSVISMISGQVDSPIIEYFALVDGQLDYITSRPMAEAMEDSINLTMLTLDDYIVNDSNEFYKLKAPEAEDDSEADSQEKTEE